MTISLHKLWAGSGYGYLTRQVAALDATELRGSLASYYSERGETPGLWVGAGMAGIDGLVVGDVVTADQMQALFAWGEHPLAADRQQDAGAAGLAPDAVAAAGRLGAPYRLAQPAPNARALTGASAGSGRRPPQPVAGYDLTFSPVKSVSTLWAVADPPVASQIEQAHHAAVADALRFLERHALFTREGARGVRQVDVRGLVAAAFTHRDSRAGDPDLHTHVAVANKVQTLAGKWLAIDGRVLHNAATACSETYNTALEAHLQERLGLRFADIPRPDGKRPVREVVGVDRRLCARWSTRRQAIDVRRAELARRFEHSTGRPPTKAEGIGLAQQATLETRDRKHNPRTLAEQRTTWHAQAVEVLGGTQEVTTMVTSALHPGHVPPTAVDVAWVTATAGRVIAVVEGERAVWTPWHVHAEALRQVRGANVPPAQVGHIVELVVGESLDRSVPLTVDPIPWSDDPEVLRRSDGSSVYTVAGSAQYTSRRILGAEQRLLELAGQRDGRRVDPLQVDLQIAIAGSAGYPVNDGQAALVRELATSGARLQLALAPAGTGKTTALKVLADTWTAGGGTVVGLAPSAAAAAVLGEQLSQPADTLHKLAWHVHHSGTPQPAWITSLGPGSLVLIDEAGLADTLTLDTVTRHVLAVGGSVRLIGDDRQLAAVGAGGILTDLAAAYGATRLTDVVRFADPAEAAASLALRDGNPDALGFHLDQHRVHVGDPTTAPDQLFTAWAADRAAGLDSLMLAPTSALVADLNARARDHRLQGDDVPAPAMTLADGNAASAGDTILCRRNDRRLHTSRSEWIRNGDRLTVTEVHPDGSLTARRINCSGQVRLPSDYVTGSVQLGYASTIHAAQGVTCDTVHGLITGTEDRAQLYTLLTRGRTANDLYLQQGDEQDLHELPRPGEPTPPTAVESLEGIVRRDTTTTSATSALTRQAGPAARLADAVDRYLDGLHLAADHTTPKPVSQQLDQRAEQLLPGLTGQPAWPTLRSSLLLAGVQHGDPDRRLSVALAVGGPLDTAADPAAVLHRRVAGMTPLGVGPLPWLPALPRTLADDPGWGPYLRDRHAAITHLADDVRHTAPTWAAPGGITDHIAAEVTVFRAAQRIPDDDQRATGAPLPGTVGQWQHRLDGSLRLAAHGLTSKAPASPAVSRLAQRLRHLGQHGIAGAELLQRVTAEGPLPDQHSDAALWWRLHRHLPTPVLTAAAQEALRDAAVPTEQRPPQQPTPHRSLDDHALDYTPHAAKPSLTP